MIRCQRRTGDDVLTSDSRFHLKGQHLQAFGDPQPTVPRRPRGRQFFAHQTRFDREAIMRAATILGDNNPLHHNPSSARLAGFNDLLMPAVALVVLLTAMAEARLATEVHQLRFTFRRPVLANESIKIALNTGSNAEEVDCSVEGRAGVHIGGNLRFQSEVPS